MKTSTLLISFLFLIPLSAFSQDGRPVSIETNVQSPRAMAKAVSVTVPNKDSAMAGGQGHPLVASSVTLPLQCALDNTLKGCDGYCTANPTASGCGSTPSAPEGSGGAGNQIPPAPTGQVAVSEVFDHCGEPVQSRVLLSKGCVVVTNGYHCPLNITSTVNIGVRCR